MSGLPDFYVNANKNFKVEIREDGVLVDISNDTVRLVIKEKKSDADVDAVLDVNANVLSNGSNGEAIFTLTNNQLNIEPKRYIAEILYLPNGGGRYVLFQDIVEFMSTVAD
jgi:hypothetical protein